MFSCIHMDESHASKNPATDSDGGSDSEISDLESSATVLYYSTADQHLATFTRCQQRQKETPRRHDRDFSK